MTNKTNKRTLNNISLKWSFLLFGALSFFATLSNAFTILYPGSFDPFHRSHFEEAIGIRELTNADQVVIIPIDEAYYNEFAGVKRPRFFTDELRDEVLLNAIKSNPHLSVSKALSKITNNVFGTIIKAKKQIKDPQTALLIGTDVLIHWQKLTGFGDFIANMPLYINRDPRNPEEFDSLRKLHSKESNLHFVTLPVNGIRGGDLKISVIRDGASNLGELLPPGNEKFEMTHQKKLKKSLALYTTSLKPFDRAALNSVLTGNPNILTANPKIRALLLQDPYVEDFFMITDWKDERSQESFLAMLDSKLGIPLYERLNQGPPAWRAELQRLGSFEVIRKQSEFLRKVGYDEKSYVLNISPIKENPALLDQSTYLYHWTTDKKAKRLDRALEISNVAAMKFVHRDQYLGLAFPKLVGQRSFYTSEDPFGSMFSARDEVYAISENGVPPSLYRLKIAGGAKSKIVESILVGDEITPRPGSRYSRADVLIHRSYFEDGTLNFEERVVLNPEVVLSIEKNPADEVLRARELLVRIKNSKTDGLKIQTMDGKLPDWEFLGQLLQNYLGSTRKPKSPQTDNCANVLSQPRS